MSKAIDAPRKASGPPPQLLTSGDPAQAGGRVLLDLAMAMSSVAAIALVVVLWPA